MGTGCTKAPFEPTQHTARHRYINQIDEELSLLQSSAGGLEKLAGAVNHIFDLLNTLADEGFDGDARTYEWRLVKIVGDELQGLLPDLHEDSIDDGAVRERPCLGRDPSQAMRVGKEVSDVLTRLYSVAAQLQSDGIDARGTAILVRLSGLQVRIAFALVDNALESGSHIRSFNYARDYVMELINVVGVKDIDRYLQSRLLKQTARIEAFDPFQDVTSNAYVRDIVFLEGILGFFEISAAIAEGYDVVSEADGVVGYDDGSPDSAKQEVEALTSEAGEELLDDIFINMSESLAARTRRLHGIVLERFAMTKFMKLVADIPDDWRSLHGRLWDTVIAVTDVQYAAQLGAINTTPNIPARNEFGDWLNSLVCIDDVERFYIGESPTPCFSEHRRVQDALRVGISNFKKLIGYQQAALAISPHMFILDVVGPLLHFTTKKFREAASNREFNKISVWILLLVSVEDSIREMMGGIRAEYFSQWRHLSHFCDDVYLHLIMYATFLLDFDIEELSTDHFDDTCSLLDSPLQYCHCGTPLFFTGCALRSTYLLATRTCPWCRSTFRLERDGVHANQNTTSLHAFMHRSLPGKAKGLDIYSFACFASAQRATGIASKTDVIGELTSPRDMREAHLQFQRAWSGCLDKLLNEGKRTPAACNSPLVFAAFSLCCGIPYMSRSFSELREERDQARKAHGEFRQDDFLSSLAEPITRSKMEETLLVRLEMAEWCEKADALSKRSDVAALKRELWWAATHPYLLATPEYDMILKAYCTVLNVPETWAVPEVLGVSEAFEFIREDLRCCLSRHPLDAKLLRTLLQKLANEPLLCQLQESKRAIQEYRLLLKLPPTWDLAAMLRWDEPVLAWRSTFEQARATEDVKQLKEVLLSAAQSEQTMDLPEVQEMLDLYKKLLQLPPKWSLTDALAHGDSIQRLRDDLVEAMKLLERPLRNITIRTRGSKTHRRLLIALQREQGELTYTSPEVQKLLGALSDANKWFVERNTPSSLVECRQALEMLQKLLSLPSTWTFEETLSRIPVVHNWRVEVSSARETKDELKLIRVIVWARRDGFSKNFVEYSQAVQALAECGKSKLDLLRLPSSWSISTEHVRTDSEGINVVGLQDLPIADPLLRSVQELVDSTIQKIATRDRIDGSKVGSCQVVSIQHVRNLRAWQGYSRRCMELEAKHTGKSRDKVISIRSETLLTDGEGLKLLMSYRPAGGPLMVSMNECLLWHGTSPESASSIASADFKLSKAGSAGGTLYGRGLYFAESFTKSDEYARKVDPSSGCRAMLICRVVMGLFMTETAASPKASDLLAGILSGQYDSVVGDRRKSRGTYREFIVYDSDQAYPLFLVWYKRETDK